MSKTRRNNKDDAEAHIIAKGTMIVVKENMRTNEPRPFPRERREGQRRAGRLH